MKSLLEINFCEKMALIKISFSIFLLGFLYIQVDDRSLIEVIQYVNSSFLFLAFVLLILTIFLSSIRWHLLYNQDAKISFYEAMRITLISSTLNIFLPSKLGDIFKIYFVSETVVPSKLLPSVIYEKYLDLFGLSCLCSISILIYGDFTWVIILGLIICCTVMCSFTILCSRLFFLSTSKGRISNFLCEINNYFYPRRFMFHVKFLIFSAIIWCLHICQFYIFFKMLSNSTSFTEVYSKIPLAIYFGLLPFSVAGIGTRDFAIVYLFQNSVGLEASVLVGFLASVRYFIPGFIGIPFLLKDFKKVRQIIKDLKKLILYK